VIVFDVPWPGNVVGFVLSFLLATASMAALGLIIAALAPNGRIASGIGTGLFFVAMLFAGVWTRGPRCPTTCVLSRTSHRWAPSPRR
jgi:ABC-2 type transport system permease protein